MHQTKTKVKSMGKKFQNNDKTIKVEREKNPNAKKINNLEMLSKEYILFTKKIIIRFLLHLNRGTRQFIIEN